MNATATVSGACLIKENGQFVLYYHAGRSGSLPTEIYRATSPDMLTWTISNNGYPIITRAHPYEVDQAADASVLQTADGKLYVYYTGIDNSKPAAKIMVLRGLPFKQDSNNPKITDPAKKSAVQLASDVSISSTTFADLGLSMKFIPRGTAALVTLAGVGTNGTTSGVNYFQVTDGGSITKALGGYTPPIAGMQFGINSVALLTGLTPGQRYTLKIQCKVSVGAFLARPVSVADKELLAMIVEDANWPLPTA